MAVLIFLMFLRSCFAFLKPPFRPKAFVSIFLTLCFLVVVTTGALLYKLPYNKLLLSWHTVFGMLFMGLSFVHLKNNWKTFLSHFAHSRKNSGRTLIELRLSFVLVASIGIGAYLLSSCPCAAESESSHVIQTELELQGGNKKLLLDFYKGESYSRKEKIFWWYSSTITPQMAVWIEDIHGNYIETLYVTELSGKSSWNKLPFGKQEVSRPAALPYWSHKRGVVNEEGQFMPTKESPLPDTITGATPKGNFSLESRISEELDEFVVLLEINKSFDYNETYSKELLEDSSKSHAEKSYSGQPALVYSTKITSGNASPYYPMRLIGHSDPTGETGQLFSDTSKVDTALQMVDKILVEIQE